MIVTAPIENPSSTHHPYLGFGLGLRAEHYKDILQLSEGIDWLEILTENFLVPGGKPIYYLDRLRERYPIAMHGVSLSLGGTDPLNQDYLKQVKTLADRIQPQWISDHLCWTGINGIHSHDLLPLPFTEESINHVVSRISDVQEYLGQRILIENVSSYLNFQISEMQEWEFLSEVVMRADCYILLDVNNIYVNAYNHGFDAMTYLKNLPGSHIKQIHIAGHSHFGDYIIDTHSSEIIPSVWELYQAALRLFGKISTLIERDDNIPALSELLRELRYAKSLAAGLDI